MAETPEDLARTVDAMLNSDANSPLRLREGQRQARALVATLVTDEVTMLRHIVTGWSKAESARELGMELHQVEKRRANLLLKLNAGSTTDAVRVGIYAGLD